MIVIAATRKDGTVGYFKSYNDVPPDFKYPGEEDITGVMKSMNVNVDRCLEIMNQHWKNPTIGPRCPETKVRK